jgi:Ni/Co efflux regulator RcnB
MNKLPTILLAAVFALSGASALAADAPKADAATMKKADAALKKPDSVTQEAWDKMSDADKKKAVEKAGMTAKTAKKPKKGGC